MPSEFETTTCAICGSEVDETVESVTRKIPGATLKQRFCSSLHRQDYLDKVEHVESETPHEQVSRQLREAGMDPDAFEEDA